MPFFYDANYWSHTHTLQQSADDLRKEFDCFPRWLWINNNQRKIESHGSWHFVPFVGKGKKYWPIIWCFPTVRRLLKQLPIVDNCVFSIMGPHSSIPLHNGHPGDHVRVHLGIHTDGAAWIQVGNQRQHWQQDQVLMFDDCAEHETSNPSDQYRVVFLFDILTKDLH
jgi:beta-hydroxylase